MVPLVVPGQWRKPRDQQIPWEGKLAIENTSSRLAFEPSLNRRPDGWLLARASYLSARQNGGVPSARRGRLCYLDLSGGVLSFLSSPPETSCCT